MTAPTYSRLATDAHPDKQLAPRRCTSPTACAPTSRSTCTAVVSSRSRTAVAWCSIGSVSVANTRGIDHGTVDVTVSTLRLVDDEKPLAFVYLTGRVAHVVPAYRDTDDALTRAFLDTIQRAYGTVWLDSLNGERMTDDEATAVADLAVRSLDHMNDPTAFDVAEPDTRPEPSLRTIGSAASIPTLRGLVTVLFTPEHPAPFDVPQWLMTCPALDMATLRLTIDGDDTTTTLEDAETGEVYATAPVVITIGEERRAIRWATGWLERLANGEGL